jgi:predicted GNAT family N-acyltransferase
MIRGTYITGDGDFTDALAIRKEVFQMEQNVPAELEFDDKDEYAMHIVVYNEEDKPVATGRMLASPEHILIGRIAVIKEERGKGYGDFVVRMMLDKAFECGAAKVAVHAQIQAVGFYEKLGFIACGDEYVEANMRHLPMEISEEKFRNSCQCKGGCQTCK